MDDYDDMICLEEKIHLLHTVFTAKIARAKAKVLMDGLMEELADVKERLRDDLD